MIDTIHVQSRAVIIKEGHILICKTKGLEHYFYFLPGGHIEHGESAKNALIRELKEEVGFNFTIDRFLGCMEYAFDPSKTKHAKCHTQEYSFIFEANAKELPSPQTPLNQIEKNIEILWMELEELGKIDFRPHPLIKHIDTWLRTALDKSFASSM
ncbi:MAG: hypothetical protein RLZZ59_596 [Pseudomonadota bacterium]|jgi:ADP-ribose pyrophosphatase YjhB (NUDIX family)